MKALSTLLLTLSLSVSAAPNSIIAIVNDTIITTNSISAYFNEKTTIEQKIALVQQKIDIELQKEKIQALGIKPRMEVINSALEDVAKQNNLTPIQLRSNDQFEQIIVAVTQNLSLQGLQQVVLQQANLKTRAEQVVFFRNWVKDLRKGAYIEIFEDKLK